MPIVSISGIRGMVGSDLDGRLAGEIGRKFGAFVHGGSVAVASDTRTTAALIKEPVISGLAESGSTVYDLGMSSTPSVFKEVSYRKLDGGIVITASHNPPEWNGIKFIVRGGRGIFEDELDKVMELVEPSASPSVGRIIRTIGVYESLLRTKAGKDTAKSVKIALDMAGGVGSLFVPRLLSYQGCTVHSIHDTPGIFPRIIDPTADPLVALKHVVKSRACDAGFAYDCDADRLVIVDEEGTKLSGDATLLICLQFFLDNARNRNIAISVDTSLAAEDLIREYSGKVFHARVGEANVVRKIIENNCGAGGEGSSGGYIEPGFVMCRDGVHASTMIVKMIESQGSIRSFLSNFPTYFQERGKIEIQDRQLGPKILELIAKTEGEADLTDGVKLRFDDKSWVLIRASNTENVVRISSESKTEQRSRELVEEFTEKITEIADDLARGKSQI